MQENKQKHILIVEDSPNLRRIFVEELVRKFTGKAIDFRFRGMDKTMRFEGLTIDWCDTMTHARAALATKKFDGAIIDIGFPDSDLVSRLPGNVNGLTLVKELREGQYPNNTQLPVAITSVENVFTKISSFTKANHIDKEVWGSGLTQGFHKGDFDPATEGQNVFNSTETRQRIFNTQTVAKEPVGYLAAAILPPPEQAASPKNAADTNSFVKRVGITSWFSGKS